MNLEELRRVQSKERRTDSLQNLRPSFYQEVGDYIAELKRERERAADRADDPFSSPEVNRLTDEIETATDVVEAIYERRMGKLVKQASLAAAGMPADDEGLTAEEVDLFEDLVDRIQSNKGRVLDVLEGAESDAPADEPTGDEPASVDDLTGATAGSAAPDSNTSELSGETEPADPTPPTPPETTADRREPPGTDVDRVEPPAEGDESVSAADVMGGDPPAPPEGTDDRRDPSPAEIENSPADGDVSEDAPADRTPSEDGDASPDREDAAADEGDESVDRVTVRITRDVGPILGIDDREYTLRADDVVALPEQNATPLVEREAAEPLEE